MAKLIVELPEEVHGELKKRAMLAHRTIKEVVMELVQRFISEQQEQINVTKTGFCGKWEDVRTGDEIIEDIRSHRNWFAGGRKRRD